MNKSFHIALLLLLIPVGVTLAANNEIRFGPRPTIDLNTISTEIIEEDRFRIRLNREAVRNADQLPAAEPFTAGTFNLPDLDQLAMATAVSKVVPTFSSPAHHTRHTARHRDWGLHLWYDIHVDASQDLLAIIPLFQDLDEVDVAEPVYLKQLVSGEVFDWDEDAFIIPADENDGDSGWFPNDPQFDNQWHYHNTGQTGGTPGADIRMPEAWDIQKGDSTILVAIIDDGIQYDHPDLAANMWDGIGYNFVSNSETVIPGNHGTHVAGTVAAVSNNEVGVSGVAGGSGAGDGVRLMSAQVFEGGNSGGFENSMIWAADNGAAISQNSWGYTTAGVFEQALLDAIDYFNANGGGDVLDGGITIFAAGNSNSSGQWYPGYYEGAMSVAATNHNDERAAYSTFGEWVDLSAPGGETTAANNQGVLSTVTGSNYAYYQGTSMACPHVSGVAALVLSQAPGEFTNMELWDLLVTTTDNHYHVNPGFAGELGSGRLNALSALLEVDNYLIGLINPTGFAAEATSMEAIDVHWTPNADHDPVLLAYSEEMVFGTPTGDYEPGDEIEGGGIVIYAGADSTFTHAGLESATQYNYRIWSRKDSLYSTGRAQSATTWCDLFTAPFEESFETQQVPVCWETFAASGGNWQVGNFADGLDIEGNYAYSGSDLIFGGQDANLISPIFDFSQFEAVAISFQHYFRDSFLGGAEAQFAYSLDNGESWTTVESWSSTTANPASYEVSIPELDGEPMVRFRWKNTIGLLGYYWTMGNLAITGTALEAPEIALDTDEINMELEAGETAEAPMTITNEGVLALEVSQIAVSHDHEENEFLSVSTTTFTLEPGDDKQVQLLFDASSLEAGSHSASIHIFSNDPFSPEIQVPVVMEVIQTLPESVAEIIMDSDDHTLLADALAAAGLVDPLSGEGPFTVFAPTDQAFELLPDGLLDDLMNDPDGALTDLLLHHVVEAFVLADDLDDGQVVTTMLGEDLLITISDAGVFVNDAEVTVFDLEAENGVVHVIDGVLTPPVTTVADIITESETHGILQLALEASNLLQALEGEGPFTVFAPDDPAFDELPAGLLDELIDDPEGELTDILLYHVVEGHILAGDLSDGQQITTLLGEELTVSINADGVFINEAAVTLADLEADNGVVHAINQVLIPEADDATSVKQVAEAPLPVNLYPNPARDILTLDITLAEAENVRITIHSLIGETVSVQDLSKMPAGTHSITQNLGRLSPGTYIVSVQTGSNRENRRLQVVR